MMMMIIISFIMIMPSIS